ncbi:MAG: hypothetical protein ACO1N0_06095 [Fluviicola sp.]|jgi:hypothetical protein
MKKILIAFTTLLAFSSFGQQTKTYGMNTYKVPAGEPVKRFENMYTTEGDYSLYYYEIVGDSLFGTREQFKMKDGKAVLDVVWVEHCGLKNKEFVYTIQEAKSEIGHPETAYCILIVKTKEDKYAFKNGVKTMYYLPTKPGNVDRVMSGIQVYAKDLESAKAFQVKLEKAMK